MIKKIKGRINRNKSKFNKLNIISVVSIITLIIILFLILSINILPTKYLILVISLLLKVSKKDI